METHHASMNCKTHSGSIFGSFCLKNHKAEISSNHFFSQKNSMHRFAIKLIFCTKTQIKKFFEHPKDPLSLF